MRLTAQALAAAGYVVAGNRAVRAPAVPASPVPEPAATGLSSAARSRLKPEQLLQVQIIEACRPMVEQAGGKLVAINGELPGGSRLFRLWQAVRRASGYEPGMPDLMALSADGRAGFLELKRGRGEPDLLGRRKARGELSAEQRAWRDWCRERGFEWACVRSVREAEETLSAWGAVAPPEPLFGVT